MMNWSDYKMWWLSFGMSVNNCLTKFGCLLICCLTLATNFWFVWWMNSCVHHVWCSGIVAWALFRNCNSLLHCFDTYSFCQGLCFHCQFSTRGRRFDFTVKEEAASEEILGNACIVSLVCCICSRTYCCGISYKLQSTPETHFPPRWPGSCKLTKFLVFSLTSWFFIFLHAYRFEPSN